MKQKINIAELLTDCPKGTKLYSPIFGDVYLEKIIPHLAVVVKTICNDIEEFLYDGRYGINGECVLFPSKENRDWNTFKRTFNDGDIITCSNHCCTFVSIYKCMYNQVSFYRYASLILDEPMTFSPDCTYSDFINYRFATEEEKQKLFDAIKANGYKWNEETKTLEKLIKPKFKVGDRVVKKGGINAPVLITVVGNDFYYSNIENSIGLLPVSEQDDWELVPDKFDVTTLKPFDKVLCRQYKCSAWMPSFFGFYNEDASKNPFICSNGFAYKYCVPYEENKHLLGTTNDCDDYYKTWE